MASGLPDYYRGMDITYQTLAHMTNRPKYGAAQSADAEMVVPGLATTELVSVAGKGIIYGGFLRSINELAAAGNSPILEIDGVEVTIASFAMLNMYGASVERSYPFYIRVYDMVNLKFSTGISHGFTFETGFRILYKENNNVTPEVSVRVMYALV